MKTLKNMKTKFHILWLALVVMISACEQNETPTPTKESILPESFAVNIPESISNEHMATARAYSSQRAKGDTLQGNDIYEHLGSFIRIGEGAAEIVEGIIHGIVKYQINQPMVLSYESDEDGRTKNLEVIENVMFEGTNWNYRLTITDALNEGNDDGGKALQVFWNKFPVKGIAILKPANINANDEPDVQDAVFSIEYSEAGEHGYDASMIVSISGLPTANPLEDPYSVNTLKMFAGRKGEYVDVYGNSNHPNAVFFSGDVGFNWAFAASGHDDENIGVAEVGLPPSNLDNPSRDVLLEQYSIKNVFTTEINETWPWLPQEVLEAYLFNTDAPGYFNDGGFMMGGTSPGPEWDILADRITGLSPYNPKEISNLHVSFQ